MIGNALTQMLLYFAVLLLLVKPLGWYMARVYRDESCGLERIFGGLETGLYRLAAIDRQQEMSWRGYAICAFTFNGLGLLLLYLLLRLQGWLPLNPQRLAGVEPYLAFNTAVSFTSNTNWQSYSGETTLSYLSQLLGLTVQNFLSAATGMAVLVALIR
ncbi:MAG: potassium-transporting ATPase subunit KdpA, partial [Gemmataceae bacterium]